MAAVQGVLETAGQVMSGYRGNWWVGGGWAIDAWVGQQTRPHHDTDLVVLRSDVHELRRHLAGWIIWINEPGRFLPWDGTSLEATDACLMARPEDGLMLSSSEFAGHPEAIEVMLENTDGDTWLYRRDQRVTDHLSRLGQPARFISPEVALLYKAPQYSVERNGADFDVVLPHLDSARREWLADALRLAHPGHPWISRIEAVGPPLADTT